MDRTFEQRRGRMTMKTDEAFTKACRFDDLARATLVTGKFATVPVEASLLT